jgi:hypothetical protein
MGKNQYKTAAMNPVHLVLRAIAYDLTCHRCQADRRQIVFSERRSNQYGSWTAAMVCTPNGFMLNVLDLFSCMLQTAVVLEMIHVSICCGGYTRGTVIGAGHCFAV